MIEFYVRPAWVENPASLAKRLCEIFGGNGTFHQKDNGGWDVCGNDWWLHVEHQRDEKGYVLCKLNYRYGSNWTKEEWAALKVVLGKIIY